MKTAKIANMQYPIILVDSADQVARGVEAVQCLQTKSEQIQAYFFHGNAWFSALEATSAGAAAKIAEQVDRHDLNCAIRSVVYGVSFPTQHRSALNDPETGVEGLAPYGVIHWWEKGEEPHLYYKCDIHFLVEGEVFGLVGMGDTLAEALSHLTQQCIDHGMAPIESSDEQPLA